MVNFEKDVTIALFLVRRLIETKKFSSAMSDLRLEIFRSRFHGHPQRSVFRDIDELYNLSTEEKVTKDVIFVCNQFIHADFTFADRGADRNWEALFTSSDFEKYKWVYRVPLSEVLRILDLAIIDYPSSCYSRFDDNLGDWVVETE